MVSGRSGIPCLETPLFGFDVPEDFRHRTETYSVRVVSRCVSGDSSLGLRAMRISAIALRLSLCAWRPDVMKSGWPCLESVSKSATSAGSGHPGIFHLDAVCRLLRLY